MTTHVSVLAGIPTPTEGLCTTCHLPDLWSVNVYTMTEHVEPLEPLGTIVICGDCSHVQETA